jgi:hypothetical protein
MLETHCSSHAKTSMPDSRMRGQEVRSARARLSPATESHGCAALVSPNIPFHPSHALGFVTFRIICSEGDSRVSAAP